MCYAFSQINFLNTEQYFRTSLFSFQELISKFYAKLCCTGLLYKVSLNKSSYFKRIRLHVYDAHRWMIHGNIHIFAKFLEHTTNVQCVHP